MREERRTSDLGPRTSAGAGIAVALVVTLVIAACGGAQPPPLPEKLAKENEITALWTQIRDWRREAGLVLDPARVDVFAVRSTTVAAAKQVCVAAREVPPACNNVCDLGGAICDNAETICSIADELGKQDTYAQDKCTSAKASCREAHQTCCKCSQGTP
jgi:hypothetical protein